MSKTLVCYHTKTGNTEQMAKIISEGIRNNGLDVDMKKIEDVPCGELVNYDCIILGSPTNYGAMSWQVKKFLDDCINVHGELKGKIGGAFTSGAFIGGGSESTLIEILKAFLIHGMIIQGNPYKGYFGPVSIDAASQETKAVCEAYAANISDLVKRLFP